MTKVPERLTLRPVVLKLKKVRVVRAMEAQASERRLKAKARAEINSPRSKPRISPRIKLALPSWHYLRERGGKNA